MTEPAINAAANVVAADWREAVRGGAQLLVDVGAASPDYVDSCVRTVEKHGPYIVMAPGLALAHARPSGGALSPGLAAARLIDAVEFGHPQNDPVDLVLAFSAKDDGGHVEMLATLAKQLQVGLADQLRAAESVSEMRELLEARP